MRLKFRGAGVAMKFADGKTQFEEVRDTEFGPDNLEPVSDSEICQWSPEQYRQWRETGRRPKDEQTCEGNANAERFARASDRKNGIDNGRPTADQMAAMSPVDRFCAASAARNRLNPNYQQDALRRRR